MTPRPAATVIVVRSGPLPGRAPEVLVLQRSARSRFAPGFVVFPGGVLEPGDDELARRWFGDPGERARACAIRELAEETGLVASAQGLVHSRGTLPGGRMPSSWETGLPPPNVSGIPELSRWVAPSFLPVRFDARFFALEARGDLEPVPDGVEIERAWWSRPRDLLDAQSTGAAQLMWPTLTMLEALSRCPSVDAVLHLRVEQVSPPSPAGSP